MLDGCLLRILHLLKEDSSFGFKPERPMDSHLNKRLALRCPFAQAFKVLSSSAVAMLIIS